MGRTSDIGNRKRTMFTWGYWGWGNSTRELVRAVDVVEKKRGFKPPIFKTFAFDETFVLKAFWKTLSSRF